MQRRIVSGKLPIRLGLLTCLALPILPTTVHAQASAAPGTTQAVASADAPQILLVIRRDPKMAARDAVTFAALQDQVIALMRESGHYQVIHYTPTNPLIKRQLTQHTISSIDLNEPLQAEGMRHLAVALGIRTVLFLTPTIDKTDLKMSIELHQNLGQNSWQTAITEEADTPFQFNKRRLNSKEAVAFTVDALAARLSLPSHLAADLNLKTTQAALDKTQETKKPSKEAQTRKTTPVVTPQNPVPDTAVATNTVQDPPTTTTTTVDPMPTAPTQPTVTKQPKTREATAPKVTKADKNSKPGRSSEEALSTLNNAVPQNGTNVTGTYQAEVPTTQTVVHPNYETLADHFHDNHDLANTITLLRYAVNERPRDVNLRRKLILAYQERSMPETALAEINRALQIAPTEGSLYRSYGDTLMAKGDIQGAEKAFREALRLNADDLLARVALGDALMTDNQYADALDAYTVALKADPHSALPHRRLARVMLMRAAADPTQYAASVEEIGKSQEFIPKNDTISYQQDYGVLMQITEARLREVLEEISGNFVAFNKGKQNATDTLRALSDIQLRTDAISAYLDKVPAAPGQDKTHPYYQQAATLALQSITLFRSYLGKNDAAKQQMQDASAEAYQALDTAHKRLASVRATLLPK